MRCFINVFKTPVWWSKTASGSRRRNICSGEVIGLSGSINRQDTYLQTKPPDLQFQPSPDLVNNTTWVAAGGHSVSVCARGTPRDTSRSAASLSVFLMNQDWETETEDPTCQTNPWNCEVSKSWDMTTTAIRSQMKVTAKKQAATVGFIRIRIRKMCAYVFWGPRLIILCLCYRTSWVLHVSTNVFIDILN